MPIVVIAGFVQRRDRIEPDADDLDAVEQAALLAEARLVVVEVGGLPRVEPRHGDGAVGVVQAREQAHEGGDGVDRSAAVHPRVHRVVERAHGDDGAHAAAQRRRQGRRAHGPVGRVGDDDGVGGEPVTVSLEDRLERRRARLLLALDEDRQPHGQVAGMGAQCGDVCHHARLVVGRAPAVEAPVALGRLEGRCVPVGLVTRRLHVVVRIERHRRRPLGSVDVADDRRPTPLGDDLDLEPLGAQQPGHGLRAAGDLRLVEAARRDARDAHEGLEVGPHLGHELGHAGADPLDLVGGQGWGVGCVSHASDPTDVAGDHHEPVMPSGSEAPSRPHRSG